MLIYQKVLFLMVKHSIYSIAVTVGFHSSRIRMVKSYEIPPWHILPNSGHMLPRKPRVHFRSINPLIDSCHIFFHFLVVQIPTSVLVGGFNYNLHVNEFNKNHPKLWDISANVDISHTFTNTTDHLIAHYCVGFSPCFPILLCFPHGFAHEIFGEHRPVRKNPRCWDQREPKIKILKEAPVKRPPNSCVY